MELYIRSSNGFQSVPSYDKRNATEATNLVQGDTNRYQPPPRPRSYRHSLTVWSLTDALLDITLTTLSVYFFVFAFIVWRRDQSPIDTSVEDNSLLNAAKFVSHFLLSEASSLTLTSGAYNTLTTRRARQFFQSYSQPSSVGR